MFAAVLFFCSTFLISAPDYFSHGDDFIKVLLFWFEDAMKNLLQTLRDVEGFLGLPHVDYSSMSELNPLGHIRLRTSLSVRTLEFIAPLVGAVGLAPWLGTKLCSSTGEDCGGHGSMPLTRWARSTGDKFFALPNTYLLRFLHPHDPQTHHSSEERHAYSPAQSGVVDKFKQPAPPPAHWPFLCECFLDSSATHSEEICYGEDALERITGLVLTAKGLPPHFRSSPKRPRCSRAVRKML